MIVVADAGPLIHLSLVGRIDLLPTLYGRVLVPKPVYQEVVENGEGLAGSAELRDADWAELADPLPNSELFLLLSADLDPGESAALSLAVERKAALLLSDDRPARQAAGRLGLPVIGTLGILTEAKRRTLIEELRPYLLKLKEEGVWLSAALLQQALSSVGEQLE